MTESSHPLSMRSRPQPAGALVVIPARDEAATLGALLAQVANLAGCRVLVVSDDSCDATAELARTSGARVIDVPLQLGAWGATQAGLRYAQRNGFRTVVTLDGDGQHDPDSVPRLLAEFQRGDCEVLIGTFPERLSRGRKLAWSWFRALTGLKVEDLTSGFRVYGPEAIAVLASPEATLLDYQDVGVLLLLRKHGMRIRELPVTMFPRQNGHSKVFASWLLVAGYMLQTTVLCIARVGLMRRRAPLPIEA
jgi:glycosyltransferase involved in cell wall biosynthesis